MIDLRSDTVTRPDAAMREAAAAADVGDDVYGEDPTVNELEARTAEVLGTEDALFCVSGTMANQVAARTHTERGHEVLCEARSHIYSREVAGLAQHGGLQTRPLAGDDRGALAAEQVRTHLAEADDHQAGTGLLALENTHNRAGGTALAPDRIAEAAEVARAAGVPVHLDGARLWNAAVAHGRPVAEFVGPVDSVMASFSKGLGAPMGSILAGGADFIAAARRVRKLFGGGWRQAGVVAAPALDGLANRERLATDHERARTLAAGLADLEGVDVQSPETNIVLVETAAPAEQLLQACEAAGVRGSPFGEHVVRFCTHRDVDGGDVQTAIEAVSAAV
jgi:threonine aldolase